MSGNLYILTGAAGSGKTTLLNAIVKSKLAVKAPKYSERPSRGPDDDIIHTDNIENSGCNIIYTINDRRYGINTNLIKEEIEREKDLFVSLSDLRIIRRLKSELGNRAKALYISSAIDEKKLEKIQHERHPFAPTEKQKEVLYTLFYRLKSASKLEIWPKVVEYMGELVDSWKDALPESRSTEIRQQKIRAFHSRFIDNIALFDHVILNYYEPELMTEQAKRIIEYYKNKQKVETNEKKPVVFMVCAASGAGKGTLMESLNIMGSQQIAVVSKMGRRAEKETDKRDGMIAIGPNGEFPPEYDWRWEFHKGNDFKGIKYAVSTDEIGKNISENKTQILISNMGQIEKAKEIYGEHMVFIYLHATRTEEQIRKYQYESCKTGEEAETRIGEIKKVHEAYIENICSFDHVLLNTTYEEDLYDQMFCLIEHYR